MEKRPDPKRKKSLRERFNEAFPDVSRDEWKRIAKDTLRDLRDPKEIALLLGGAVVPGGFIGYGAYRVVKYRQKQAANDNKPSSQGKKKTPKPPFPPKT